MKIVRPPFACLLAALLASAGCGDDPPSAPVPVAPTSQTPQQTMARFEQAYEAQDLPAYAGLLAADFHYRFSPFADPGLVSQYGHNWGTDHEMSSTIHLRDGFTNEYGVYVAGADSIALSLAGIHYEPDPEHADSTRHYVVADSAQVTLAIVLPAGLVAYHVASIHSFFLVRGDAAHLETSQTADSTRWYIRRWDDLASPQFARATRRLTPARGQSTTGTTWGSLKAAYR